MDINKAKENLKGYLNWLKTNGFSMAKNDEAIQIILSELDKKDKIINLMAQELINTPIRISKGDLFKFTNIPNTLEYFTNKVEEDIKE